MGASNAPHAEILEQAKPLLKEKGIDLEIVTFQDYVLPNKALAKWRIRCKLFPTHSLLRMHKLKKMVMTS